MTPPVNAAQIYMELFPELPAEDHPAKEYPIVFAICGVIAELRAIRMEGQVYDVYEKETAAR